VVVWLLHGRKSDVEVWLLHGRKLVTRRLAIFFKRRMFIINVNSARAPIRKNLSVEHHPTDRPTLRISSRIFTDLYPSFRTFTHLFASLAASLPISSRIFTHLYPSLRIFTHLSAFFPDISGHFPHLAASLRIFTGLYASLAASFRISSSIFTHLYASLAASFRISSCIFTHLSASLAASLRIFMHL
jgi:hypothetical protein